MAGQPRHFTDLSAVSATDLRAILDDAVVRKAAQKAGTADKPFDGKVLAMIFEKPSTRTRVSFDVAMRQLGGETIMLTGTEMQLGRSETIADTAKVLSRYVDAIMIRTTTHDRMLELAENATVPVINALTDDTHPCQLMADIMAIAKGIGGGFPMGACLATDDAASGMIAGVHGTTFGGNPLAMAVGNAVLDVVLEPGFLDEVKRKALLLKQGLAAVADEFPDVIEGIRGAGLMAGIKCRLPAATVNLALREEKMLAAPAGDNVIRLLPPLIVSDEEIRTAVERIRAAAASLSTASAARASAAE